MQQFGRLSGKEKREKEKLVYGEESINAFLWHLSMGHSPKVAFEKAIPGAKACNLILPVNLSITRKD